MIETTDGVIWDRQEGQTPSHGVRSLRDEIGNVVSADEQGREADLPILAFYDADRAGFDVPRRRSGFDGELPRYAALEGALSARIEFRDFFEWFKAKEDKELRDQKRDPSAVSTELPGRSHCDHVDDSRGVSATDRVCPLRFVVSLRSESGRQEDLTLDQIGGGYRVTWHSWRILPDAWHRQPNHDNHVTAKPSC